MITSGALSNNRAPSVWMTVLSLVASGWVASFFVGFTVPLRLFAPGIGVSLVYSALVSALIGGVALRFILPLLTGVEISYPWAVAALGLGSLVSTAVTTTIQTATLRHAPSVAPAIWSSPLLMLAATGASLVVSYWVIALGGHTRASALSRTRRRFSQASPSRQDATTEDNQTAPAPTSDASQGLGMELVRVQNAVTDACINISRASTADIPGCVVDALTEISISAYTLRTATIPDATTGAVVDNLVAGLDRFAQALTDIASDAAATGSDRLPQRGLLLGSLADVSDGGGRARYELDHADGLAEIRTAFETLRRLGYLREGA
jgi:hypothetical protein